MPPGYRKLSKDDLNGDAALDTAGTAKEGVLQRLELPERDNGHMSWAQISQPYEAQGCKMACCNLTSSCTEFAHCKLQYREKMDPTEAQALLKRACTACLTFPSS